MSNNATMIVVDASGISLNGQVWHTSGDGSKAPTDGPFKIINLPQFTASQQFVVTSRGGHDDYWFWQPNGGQTTELQYNLDGSLGACLVISDQLMVVVTTSNKSSKIKLNGSAAATAQAG